MYSIVNNMIALINDWKNLNESSWLANQTEGLTVLIRTLARQASTRRLVTSTRSPDMLSREVTYEQASSLESTSHRPSQASSKNWSCDRSRSQQNTSGSGETSCSHGSSSGSRLYAKSPKALLTARLPLTRERSTAPPALRIRRASSGQAGLWSLVQRTGAPPLQTMARESPQLASHRRVGSIKATTAVQPAPAAAPPVRSLSSCCRKPVRRASPRGTDKTNLTFWTL